MFDHGGMQTSASVHLVRDLVVDGESDRALRRSSQSGSLDFEWPEYRLVGEFDGRSKYLKPVYLGRMTPGDAVVEEKVREDHIRAEGFRFVRWGVPELRQPALLRALVLGADLPERVFRTR